MRKVVFALLGTWTAVSLSAQTAGASTFSVVYQSSGGICTAGSAACVAKPGDTVLIDVFINQNTNSLTRTTSVGLDLTSMGLVATDAMAIAHVPPLGTASTLNGIPNPTVPPPIAAQAAAADVDCNNKMPGAANCTHRFTSFGYFSGTSGGNGNVWAAGTITLDLTGATPGTYTIVTYARVGIDSPSDSATNPHNVLTLTVRSPPSEAPSGGPVAWLVLFTGLALLGARTVARRARSS